MDVSRPQEPVIVDELLFGVDARPHWLGLEPGGNRIVMTGGGTLAGGVYLIDVDPETGKLRLAGDLPATGSGIAGIRLTVMSGPMARPVRLSRMELCLVP